jgi:TGF-beta propeptide
MRRLHLIATLAALALAGAPAGAPAVAIPPSADVGLPFWCDWSYDWESRCYRDDGMRLPIGGVDDKVWRAALGFSLAAIPSTATITSAELRLRHDGTCVAPRLTAAPCAIGYVIDAHRILSPSWFRERELEFDERVADTAVVFSGSTPQWLTWNVTSLVGGWHTDAVPNHGLLLKLQDGDEDYGVSGPYGPSAGYPDESLRPHLVVDYVSTGSR